MQCTLEFEKKNNRCKVIRDNHKQNKWVIKQCMQEKHDCYTYFM